MGNTHKMQNYRGILLMSVAAKVYNRMLLDRIYEEDNKKLSDLDFADFIALLTEHVSKKILLNGAKPLFAMKTLMAHGMPVKEIHECYRATALNSLLDAAAAWWGFTSA